MANTSTHARNKTARKVVPIKNKANPETVQFSKDTCRWFENVVLKEQALKSGFSQSMQAVQKEAGELTEAVFKNHGVHLKDYEVNWQTGVATLRKVDTDGTTEGTGE